MDKDKFVQPADCIIIEDAEPEEEEGDEEEKEKDDLIVTNGGEVKALADGKVAGYLVLFSTEDDPDLTGDFFTKETDFGDHDRTPTFYHHGLDMKIGARVIGKGALKSDDVGVWVEAQLELRDKYEKAIYELAKRGKLGWSSGTAPHLVKRERRGESNKILSWPLGLDASLTPTPAEPRNKAISLKAIKVTDIETEAGGAASSVGDFNLNNLSRNTAMADEEKKAAEEKAAQEKAAAEAALKATDTGVISGIFEKVTGELAQRNAMKVAAEKQKQVIEDNVRQLVEETMKAVPAGNAGSPTMLNLKTKRGDDAVKALNHYLKTGDNGGLRAQPEYKTDYWLVEGTTYQGAELVPTEIARQIFELRDPLSVARAAGSVVLPVTTSTVNVPKEKIRQGVFVAPGEKTAYDQLEQQIFDKTAITITKYTRNIPISEELMEDSVVDLVPYLTRNLGRALAITENAHFITASTGAWYGSTKGLDFDSATAIGVAEIPELYGKLLPEYRDNVVWIMLPATHAYIMALNSAYAFPFVGNGGWSGSLGNTMPGSTQPMAMLLGGRVFTPGSVDAIGTSKKSVMIGNFSAGYVICERKQLTIVRDAVSSVSEGVINILASTRIGGGIVNSEAFQHGLHPTA